MQTSFNHSGIFDFSLKSTQENPICSSLNFTSSLIDLHKNISIVIPVFNEEKNIRPLYLQLKKVLTATKNPYEIIFIDDGSTDATLKRLLEVKAKGENVKIIQMQGNFGKASALQAGFDQSKGEYLITLDGDLQDDPREIPNFLIL